MIFGTRFGTYRLRSLNFRSSKKKCLKDNMVIVIQEKNLLLLIDVHVMCVLELKKRKKKKIVCLSICPSRTWTQ